MGSDPSSIKILDQCWSCLIFKEIKNLAKTLTRLEKRIKKIERKMDKKNTNK